MTVRPTLLHRFVIAGACLGLFCTASSAAPNPADYPLRVHIYRMNEHEHRHNGIVDFVDGEGRANLFENGVAKGVDFSFSCYDRFMTSSGGETYPAKWKKPGQSLVILMHKIGTNSAASCELKVDVKDFAYYAHNGALSTEPIAAFKQWMTEHQYDPEHGMEGNFGTVAKPATAPGASVPAPQ
jgi:hypothetical protein